MGTNPAQNQATYLIDNVLIGNGVTTSNHVFTGDSSQMGYFTESSGLIGFMKDLELNLPEDKDAIGKIGADTMTMEEQAAFLTLHGHIIDI